MASEEHYRERARECMQAADTMFETDRKVSLLELAQRWLRLAHHAEATAGDALLRDTNPNQWHH